MPKILQDMASYKMFLKKKKSNYKSDQTAPKEHVTQCNSLELWGTEGLLLVICTFEHKDNRLLRSWIKFLAFHRTGEHYQPCAFKRRDIIKLEFYLLFAVQMCATAAIEKVKHCCNIHFLLYLLSLLFIIVEFLWLDASYCVWRCASIPFGSSLSLSQSESRN